MKAAMNSPYSISEAENEQIYVKQDKIELLSCPRKKMICHEQLSFVNKCYVQSEQSFIDKDFHRSIDALKNAFYKTAELNELPCAKCAALFRSTIVESVENYHNELERMTSGLFGKKSYISSREKAANVLDEFEKVKLHESFTADKTKNRFIGSYLKQKVS